MYSVWWDPEMAERFQPATPVTPSSDAQRERSPMKLLAVEAQQFGGYYLPRYEQVEEFGGNLHLLHGIGEPDFWPAPRYRVAGSAKIDDLIAAATAWHAEQHFDGVLTFSESSVMTVALLAEALGLPGVGLEAARNSRNKLCMRQAHERGGVPHPGVQVRHRPAGRTRRGCRIRLSGSAQADHGYCQQLRLPDRRRRAATARYHDATEGIERMLAYVMEAEGIDIGPHGLLVESFLDGHEYLFEAVVWDGEVFLGSIVDRATIEGATFDDDVHVAPTSLTDAQLEEIRQIISDAARAHGLRRSVMHAEIRFHQGRPHLVEIAIRPGGGGLDLVARTTAGYCPIRATMDVARGVRPAISHYQPTGVYMMGTCLICEAGELEYVRVPTGVRESERTLLARITARPGRHHSAAPGRQQHPGIPDRDRFRSLPRPSRPWKISLIRSK